VESFFYW